ncbi:MAG: hypothetical protein AAFR96_07765 [Planctomycetota bacterium]
MTTRSHIRPFARCSLLAALAAIAGCIQQTPPPPTPDAPRPTPVLSSSGLYEVTHAAEAQGVGAAQGIFAEGNFVYVFGDLYDDGTNGPGIIREFFFSTDDNDLTTLFPSGREIRLTEGGQDIAPHPTGLTWHPNFGYWLGDTVEGRGRLFQIDFARAIRQGTLDGCVIHSVDDDAAVNGTRPMFLTLPGGRVTLATSDYGDQANALRLYDPVALLAADNTSQPGVLVSEAACGPWVQSLASRGNPGQLWLVQNQTEGLGYRLTEITLDDAGEIISREVVDFVRPTDELEGLLWLEPDRQDRVPFVMVNAGQSRNVYFGRLNPEPTFVNPIQRQLDR